MEYPNRILVVDDEEPNRELLEAMLIPLGYDVDLACDGEDAFIKVSENPPDIILLDIMMPKIDGIEVARRLKSDASSKLIPIVIVTALREVEIRVKALEAGADDFLTKPVDKTELTARVKSLLKVKAFNDHMLNYQRELESEVRNRTEELHQALSKLQTVSLSTIFRLARAAEYKDEDTGAHLQRMSRYSAAVARELGLDNQLVESILYAAPMHDVGKIGIPDHILLKPAKLTDDEWKIMKRHPYIGAKILESPNNQQKDEEEGFIKVAKVIAYSHHEKWDGSGYPRRLKGDNIPIEGRITAIADVFDALTSKRPYKDPFSLEKSFKILKEGSGSHFDPKVVDAFFNRVDEILEIKEKYKDHGESLLYQMVNPKTLQGDPRP